MNWLVKNWDAQIARKNFAAQNFLERDSESPKISKKSGGEKKLRKKLGNPITKVKNYDLRSERLNDVAKSQKFSLSKDYCKEVPKEFLKILAEHIKKLYNKSINFLYASCEMNVLAKVFLVLKVLAPWQKILVQCTGAAWIHRFYKRRPCSNLLPFTWNRKF